MSKQAMNYIIEKMRGDSLTPLGSNKPNDIFFKSRDMLIPYKTTPTKFRIIVQEYLKKYNLFKGKWIPENKDPNTFFCEPVAGILYMVNPSVSSSDQAAVLWFSLLIDKIPYQDLIIVTGTKEEMVMYVKDKFGIVWG